MRKRKTKRRRRGGGEEPQRNINIGGTNLAPSEFFHNPIPLVAQTHQFNIDDAVRVISGPYIGSTGTIFTDFNNGTYEVYLEPHGGEEILDGSRLVLEGGRRRKKEKEEKEEKEEKQGKKEEEKQEKEEEEPKRKEKDIEEKKNEYNLT